MRPYIWFNFDFGFKKLHSFDIPRMTELFIYW